MDIHDISNLGERCETSVCRPPRLGSRRGSLGRCTSVSTEQQQLKGQRPRARAEQSRAELTHSSNTYCWRGGRRQSWSARHRRCDGERTRQRSRDEGEGEARRPRRGEAVRQTKSRGARERGLEEANWRRGAAGRVEIRMRKKKRRRRHSRD